ncbi:MAG: SDR family oxidoreductase [Nitrospirae bacterium]|nr:MAG: SDR family oxidoreductase [Nitrospirota bacterium]
MPRLHEKIAIVTGSSSGIGKAIALRFGQEGAVVIVAARRELLCQQTVRQIVEAGGQAHAIPTDIRDEQQVDQLVQETVRCFGRLDILVNNAGIYAGGPVAEIPTATFDEVMNTNVRGTFFCCRAGMQQMKRQRNGVIINMSSLAGVEAWAGTGVYSASKFAVIGLTHAMADEGRRYGVKVCALCPAGVADELVDASPDLIQRSPKIDPYDIAETAVYLSTLGPQAIVKQIVIDRMGADW